MFLSRVYIPLIRVRMVAIVVGFCFFLMFFFVPETFWDRTPHAHEKNQKSTLRSISDFFHQPHHEEKSKHSLGADGTSERDKVDRLHNVVTEDPMATTIAARRQQKRSHRVGFADAVGEKEGATEKNAGEERGLRRNSSLPMLTLSKVETLDGAADAARNPASYPEPLVDSSPLEGLDEAKIEHLEPTSTMTRAESATTIPGTPDIRENSPLPQAQHYTNHLRSQPPKPFLQTLKPWNGQLRHENWFLVALRPFILFAYPAILWSALVYSLSIGWLIVLSETVSEVYRTKDYHFSPLGVGLVYISPFIGGILGTAVAGKVSDIIVKAMSRRNGGVYEPEFRLVMAIPVALATCIGLMGFGWSAEDKDNWIVPTVFFGIISFGSSLGSTTSITFAVDSYRMYAGESLVTLNFSKNVFHGLVFSLFFNHWLEAKGSKKVFQTIGGLQLACLLTTIPMYVYGKRARMWTYRKNLMEKF